MANELFNGTWLVTGGCGFIGSEFIRQVLVREDLAGVKIVNIDALSYAASPERLACVEKMPRYRFVKGNIAHAEEVKAALETCKAWGDEGPAAVINFAAESHVDRSLFTGVPFVMANTLGVQESLPQNWQLKAVPVDTRTPIADAIETLMKQNVDVVWTTPDSTIYDTASVRALLLASIRTNTPVFGFSPAFVKAGAILGIGIDPQAQGQQAATLALRLLNPGADAKPPAVNPTESYQIAINLIVAGQIKMDLPPALVQRATHVFKESR